MSNGRKILFCFRSFFSILPFFLPVSKLSSFRVARNALLGTLLISGIQMFFCCLFCQMICYFVPCNACVGLDLNKFCGPLVIHKEFQVTLDLFC